MPYRSATDAFIQGARALAPLAPGVVPFGLVTGVTAIDLGMTPATAIGMTLLFYSGSAQMAALELMRHGVLPVAILFTALIINLRFVMYSATLAPHMHHLPRRGRWSLAYLLSDQSFALCSLKLANGELGRYAYHYYAGTAVAMWLAWQLSVAAGVGLGAGIPASWQLGFAIPLSFLALLVPAVRNLPSLGAAIVGGVLAVVAIGLPYNLGLVLASLGGIATGLLLEGAKGRAALARREAP
ncbi:AzlC family ABC transporter permease [Pseudomonas sp. NPDC007930]|uniref:AzlC family ABC transporter permease n=1 Tax=Pseudomonas sp. NPDC007930 TaxID=3364417 RepID=UPI0036E6E5C5